MKKRNINNGLFVRCLCLALLLMMAVGASADERRDGEWVSPADYFDLTGSLSLSEISAIVDKSDSKIAGMKLVPICIGDSKNDKGGVKPDAAEPLYLYVGTPASWQVSWQNKPAPSYMFKGYVGANAIMLSYNEATKQYSCSYVPSGRFDFVRLTKDCPVLKAEFNVCTDCREMEIRFSNGEMGGYILNKFNEIDGHVEETYLLFRVEEVLLEELNVTPLTEEERQEFIGLMDDLMKWLKGEGDPLGLGKHTGPMTSVVVETIGIIGSILLGNGIVGVMGGSGGGLAGDLLSNLPTGGGSPPDIPELPRAESTEPKREEEEEEVVAPPDVPKEEEGNDGQFHPTNYPELCEKYLRSNPDGTLNMNDPVTGKPLTYYPTPDGKWESELGTTYTNAELEENLRYRYDNAAVLKQDADTAASNVKAQHDKWEADAKRDKERGYSDKLGEIRDKEAQERAALEAQMQKEDNLNRLAEKYGTAPTEDAIKRAIKQEQLIAQYEHDDMVEWDEHLAKKEQIVNIIDKAADTTVNVMGEYVPGGRVVKNAYTFTRSVASNFSDALARGKHGGELLKQIASGVADGALGVMQNQAGDITNNVVAEGVMVVGGEGVRAGLKGITEGKSPEEIYNDMKGAMGTKTIYFGIGKGVQKVASWTRDSANQSLNPNNVSFKDDTGLRLGKETATSLQKALDKQATPTQGWTNSNFWKTAEKNFGKTGMDASTAMTDPVEGLASLTQETFATTTNVINESVDSQNDAVKELEKFTKNVKDFSNAAAKYKRK